MPKKAKKSVRRKYKVNTTRETEVDTSRSQIDPSELQLKDTVVSNLEIEWSEAARVRIYETSHLELGTNEEFNVAAMEEDLEEAVPETLDAKFFRLKAFERKTARDFKRKGIEKEYEWRVDNKSKDEAYVCQLRNAWKIHSVTNEPGPSGLQINNVSSATSTIASMENATDGDVEKVLVHQIAVLKPIEQKQQSHSSSMES